MRTPEWEERTRPCARCGHLEASHTRLSGCIAQCVRKGVMRACGCASFVRVDDDA